jgi:hypothetical protein
MQFICDILTVLLGYIEIDKFKVIVVSLNLILGVQIKSLLPNCEENS